MRVKFTAQDFDKALPLLRKGLTIDEIAAKTGLSANVLTYKLRPYQKRTLAGK